MSNSFNRALDRLVHEVSALRGSHALLCKRVAKLDAKVGRLERDLLSAQQGYQALVDDLQLQTPMDLSQSAVNQEFDEWHEPPPWRRS